MRRSPLQESDGGRSRRREENKLPCYSRVVSTKMTDKARIMDALKATGHRVTINGDFIYGQKANGSTVNFRRAGTSYSFEGDQYSLPVIARKYSELGVRSFAKARGFSVIDADDRQLTIINRRG